MNIPAGYAIAVTSWENDGDNYKTTNTYGLSRDEIEALLVFLNPFTGEYESENWGNEFVDTDELIEWFNSSSIVIRDLAGRLVKWGSPEYPVDFVREFLTTFLTNPSEEYFSMGGKNDTFCRAIDFIKIYHYTSEVVEVTEEFA